MQLSDSQKGILDDWKRPHEIYDDARIMPRDGEKADLTQDLVTDCSVVASLCAGSRREEKGLGRVSSHRSDTRIHAKDSHVLDCIEYNIPTGREWTSCS